MFKLRKEEKAISLEKIPKRIGIIMDGNSHWAKKRIQPRVTGYKTGMDALQDVTIAASEFGIKVLTVYAFSTGNWPHPGDEVRFTMSLLAESFGKHVPELGTNNVRVQVISETNYLPRDTSDAMKRACEKTKYNSGSTLSFTLNYGECSEIIEAVRNIVQEVFETKINPDDITEDVISNHLMANHLLCLYRDPDLIIRASGELRLSNFLPWQSVCGESYLTPVLWPDFKKDELIKTIAKHNQRHRRSDGI